MWCGRLPAILQEQALASPSDLQAVLPCAAVFQICGAQSNRDSVESAKQMRAARSRQREMSDILFPIPGLLEPPSIKKETMRSSGLPVIFAASF